MRGVITAFYRHSGTFPDVSELFTAVVSVGRTACNNAGSFRNQVATGSRTHDFDVVFEHPHNTKASGCALLFYEQLRVYADQP